MKLMIDIPEDTYNDANILIVKDLPELKRIIANGIPVSTEGDLISREALRKAFHERIWYFDKSSWDEANALIDSAPTVSQINIFCENADEKAIADMKEELQKVMDLRPQGEYVPISKLRLMTVEECAGHTIDYAMGWKACIEWIKKGGAEE